MGIKYNKQDVVEAEEMARWDRQLASGTYPAKIITGVEHEGPKGPCGKYTFFIYAPDSAAPEGPVKIDTFVSTFSGVKQFLKIFDPAKLQLPDNEIEIEPEDYVGGVCRVLIVQEEYEGKVRPKIGNILPSKDEKPEAPQEKKAAPKEAKKEPAKKTAKTAVPDEEEDLPF